MRLYGSDKPDLRVKLEFTELTDVMKDVDFKVFSNPPTRKDGRVVGLRVPGGGGEMSRGEIDGYTEFVKIYGAKGLAWVKVNDVAKGREGLQSPDREEPARRRHRRDPRAHRARNGDLLFFGADKAKVVNDAIGALRVKVGHSAFGKSHGLFDGRGSRCGWSTSRCSSSTRTPSAGTRCTTRSPRPRTATKTGWRPTRAAASPRPTTVLNGIELGGGSVRIHREEVQSKVFRALKIAPRKRS
jgi:aspartyl-tRNA synthetase